MIIGHAPSGYITAKLLLGRFAERGVSPTWFLIAGIGGALAPDLDMIYFHLVDHRQHHHHTYFPHFPILWLCMLALSFAWLRLNHASKGAALAFVFCVGGFIHMILDSIVGDIWWLAPFVDRPFAMFTVPSLYHPWWLNFILHWSFALELLLWLWALLLLRKQSNHSLPP
ncbi:MAG: metal-dependent hydrolase [Methylococcaceae bacterium]|nr:MAG: metal-dependent hydrolase [Methylococcaceae bacterium]